MLNAGLFLLGGIMGACSCVLIIKTFLLQRKIEAKVKAYASAQNSPAKSSAEMASSSSTVLIPRWNNGGEAAVRVPMSNYRGVSNNASEASNSRSFAIAR
jgi:hypothetical protein